MTFESLKCVQTNKDKRKIILLLCIILLLAFLATSIASFFVSKSAIHKSIVETELPLTGDTIYSEIQKDLIKPLLISSTMASDTFLRDWVLNGETDIQKVTNYLKEIKTNFKTITSFFVSEKTRNYYYYSGKLKTVSENNDRDSWYFRVREMDTPYEINIDPDMANDDTMTIFINYKVKDYDGNFIGATGVGLTVSKVKDLVNYYHEKFDRDILFVGEDGKVILHNNYRDNSNYHGKSIRELPGLDSVADQIMQQTENHSLAYKRDGHTILLNSRFLPEVGWFLLVEKSEDDAIATLFGVLIGNLLICLIASIAVAVLINRAINWLQRKLHTRNLELEEKKEEIEEQARQLEKNNRDLHRLNDEKDEWIGIIAHDLKSPLVSISGFSGLINDNKELDESTLEYNSHIMRSADKMLDLTTRLLDTYQAESALRLPTKHINVCEVLKESLKTSLSNASIKKISITSDIPAGDCMVLGDAQWLNTICINLISNALKFSLEGTKVHVTLERDKNIARLSVKDQGPGLSSKDQAHLFSRFSRLSAAPTGFETSTGLGLFIVRKLTEKMNGKVYCESQLGHGATFIVEIPFVNETNTDNSH